MSSYETKKIFSKNLTDFLTKNNITQYELATRMGVAPSTVSSWCSGEKMPRMDKVEWMASFFGITKSELIEARHPCTGFNVVKIAGRDGSYQEKALSDGDLAALKVLLDRLPDACDDV